MSARTYYKLGLCPCEDAQSPLYLSVAKHGLPNGYYSIINSMKPGVVYITLDPNGHVKEPTDNDDESDDDDIQPQVNYPSHSSPVGRNISRANRLPQPRAPELKPTILQAVMGNPIQNPQHNLTPTRPVRHGNPSQSIRDPFIPPYRPLKPVPFPKPRIPGPPINTQAILALRPTSTIASGRRIIGSNQADRLQAGSLPAKKKNPAPLPPRNVLNSGPPPPPIPPPYTMPTQISSTGISSDLLNSIHSFNKNNLKPASSSTRGQVSSRQSGNSLAEAIRIHAATIRQAHCISDDETETRGRNDNEWA